MDRADKALELLEAGKPAAVAKLFSSKKPSDARENFMMAEAARSAGDFHGAIAFYKKSAQLCRDFELSAKVLLGHACCLRTLGMADDALVLASSAVNLAREYEFADIELDARLEIAMAYRAKGDFKNSLPALLGLLKEYRACGDASAVSFLHWAVGGIYRLQGRFGASIKEFDAAIVLARQAHDKISLGYAYSGMAGVVRVAGNVVASEKYYRLAEGVFASTQDIFGQAYAHCGLANALRQNGKWDEAYGHYVSAHALYSSIHDEVDLGYVKWGMGSILQKKGQLKQALSIFKDGERLFSAFNERRGEILSWISIAQIYYLLGDAKKADAYFDRGVSVARKEGLHTYLETFT